METKVISVPRENSNKRDIGIAVLLTEIEWLEWYDYRNPKLQHQTAHNIRSLTLNEIDEQKKIHNIDGEPMQDERVAKALAELTGTPIKQIKQPIRLWIK